MAYIPEKHKQFDILPMCRRNGSEVVVYDEQLYDKIRARGCELSFPYNIASLEKYYEEIDSCIAKYTKLKDILQEYKDYLFKWNNKDIWGIVRYNGESNCTFTKGRCYYVPICEENGKLIPSSGVIDDEEWTTYEAWDLSERTYKSVDTDDGFIVQERICMERPRFEIVFDPSGKMKDFFSENENKVFVVFVLRSNDYSLIGLSDEIPAGWRGKKIVVEGIEYNTTPAYDLPNHIAIIGEGVEVGQEIKFV